MIRKIFLADKQKNLFLSLLVLLCNSLAALLEGASFLLLLASFSFLTGENLSTPFRPLFVAHSFVGCLLSAVVLQILRSLSVYLGQLFTTFVTLNIQEKSQDEIYKRIFKMAFSEIAQFKKGDLLHHTHAPPSFIPSLFDEYNRFLVCALMVVAYLSLMFGISWQLSSYNLLFFSAAALAQRFFFKRIEAASHIHTDRVAALSEETSQNLEAMKLVHLFHRQQHTLQKIGTLLKEITQATLGIKKWNALIPCVNESIGIIFVGISLVIGTLYLSTAQLFIYMTLTYRMATRIQLLMISKGMITSFKGQLARLNTLLSQEISTPLQNECIPPFSFQITFQGVSFRHPHKEKDALHNIHLELPKNQIIALVGTSGSGKSTLIDLLLQLYQPYEGTIMMDNLPIDRFDVGRWRQLFGVVLQDSFLFNESIEENIKLGNLDASFEQVAEAAKMAGADSFIQQLPQGYQTIVGERGYRLSGGEKQRIALAQALIKNPEILVLDEATSHLDSSSELIIQETVARLHHQKTLLIVAHRISTIRMADLIYVLEKGRIIEKGSHQDLLRLGGRYQLFWQLQSLDNSDLRESSCLQER